MAQVERPRYGMVSSRRRAVSRVKSDREGERVEETKMCIERD